MTALRNSLKRRVAKLEALRKEKREQRRCWQVIYDPDEGPVLQLEGNEPPQRPDETIIILPDNGRDPGSLGTYKNGRYIPPGSGPVIPL